MRRNPVLTGLGPSPIAALHERARDLAAEGPLVDFSVGDPDEPTPPVAREALLGSVGPSSSYPVAAGTAEARRAVADYVARRFGREVDADRHVVITAGSKEAVFHLPMVVSGPDPGAVVLHPTPGYAVYGRAASLAGLTPRVYRLAGDFEVDADLLARSGWDDVVLAWVNSPHNPAGTVVDRAELARIVEAAASAGAWLASDECYVDVHDPGDPSPASVLDVADDDLTGVVSLLSTSKRDGMTGYRVGAMVGDARLVESMRVLKQVAGTVPPEFVQSAAAAAWADDAHVAHRNEVFAAKRAALAAAFEAAGYPVVGSRAGLYLWVRVGDDVEVADRLLERRIVVSPGRVFGPGGEGHVRLALVPSVAECERAGEEIRACLTEH
ncbi:MAG: aminotransferase class I/II-fold pyridoxal phosphate-dependent enzyme [Acidimicrobiia bacterium]